MKYVVAHRGLSSKAPENTLESFDLAVSTGSKYIEFDVHLSKDNEVVIIHDDTVDRTSNGEGKVNSKSLEELKKLDFGSWFSSNYTGAKIPLLKDVLNKYRDISFVIEIKGDQEYLVQKVMEIIDNNEYWKEKLLKSENDEPDIIFCSFLPNQIIKLRKYSSDIVIGFLVKSISEDVLEFSSKLELDGIFPYYKLLNSKTIEMLNGYMVSCWGFERLEDVGKLLDFGVDAITVDWPDQL